MLVRLDSRWYLCSIMAFIDSKSDLRRSWLLSFANKNEGDDMEIKSCISLALDVPLIPSKCAAILFITAKSAGYMAESLPWLVEMRLYIDFIHVSYVILAQNWDKGCTHLDQEICVRPSKARYPDDGRECVLTLKSLIKIDPKILLDA